MKTAYFFFSFNESNRRSTIIALRSLILQVLAQSERIPDKVERLYNSEAANKMFTLEDHRTAEAVLLALLDKSPRIHVIIDGLDECRDRNVLKSVLSPLISTTTLGLVKWFLTSRTEPDFRNLAEQVGAKELIPKKEALMADIKNYLDSQRTHVHGRLDDDDSIEYWTEASEGNFLWINLMVQTMTGEYSTSQAEIDEDLERFPDGLTRCYLRCLKQISHRPEKHQELARYMRDFVGIWTLISCF